MIDSFIFSGLWLSVYRVDKAITDLSGDANRFWKRQRPCLWLQNAVTLLRFGASCSAGILLAHSKSLLNKICCPRRPISLGNHLLKLACIFTIDTIVQYLTQQR